MIIADRTAPRRTNGSKIAKARIQAGLTQEQLAAVLNVRQSAVANWEHRSPSLTTLRKIAAALGISITDLIDE